ncbi:MAG TPA: outer membrane protein assembly factor BamD [Bacteroidales bacterium]|jgi:outer membrane protein assembly factor BamD|nr:outer membrane protein assembly factor BamD [Bacteroidales bacterium]
MRFRLYIILIIAVLAVSCGEYEKLLKSQDYELKKAKAKEYYDAGQYAKATELLTQLLPRYRASAEAEDLNWMNAMSYYKMKDYFMAASYFKQFVEQYPFGAHAEEGNFMAAYCDNLIAPRPELDQENTKNAIDGFRLFITKYPNSTRVEEARKLITELQEKLVEKSYLSARLYYDMKEYKAAAVALNNSLKEYANTKYREEMMFLRLNSLFLLAENSFPAKQRERFQDALDDYYSFMEEFPKSSYSREVNNIFERTNKFLKSSTGGSETATNPTGSEIQTGAAAAQTR